MTTDTLVDIPPYVRRAPRPTVRRDARDACLAVICMAPHLLGLSKEKPAAAAVLAEQVLNAAKMLLDLGDDPACVDVAQENTFDVRGGSHEKLTKWLETAQCTGTVKPLETIEAKTAEIYYLADPNRTAFRFEGLHFDIVMSDAEAHALAGRIARGNEPEKVGGGPVKMVRARDMQFGEAGWYHDKSGAVLLTRADAMTRMSSPPRYRFKRVDEVEMLLTGDVLLEVRSGEQPPAVSFFTQRQLLTAADFKSEDEFEVYRAGADRLPLGLLPGSWEAHLLTAAAAMVVAGIERHETRMAPNTLDGVDLVRPYANRCYDRGSALRALGWDGAGDPKAWAIREAKRQGENLAEVMLERDSLKEQLEGYRAWCKGKLDKDAVVMTDRELREMVDAETAEQISDAGRLY